eukprot:10228106-Karenia_brevis.AAC.1
MQILRETPQVEAAWLAHAHLNHITHSSTSNGNWSAELGKFLNDKASTKYKSTNEYESAKILANYFKSWSVEKDDTDLTALPNVMENVERVFGKYVDFRDGRLSNTSVMHNLHALAAALDKFRPHSLNKRRLVLAFLEGAKYMLPWRKPRAREGRETSGADMVWPCSRKPEFIFQKMSDKEIKKIATSMITSVLYKQAIKDFMLSYVTITSS